MLSHHQQWKLCIVTSSTWRKHREVSVVVVFEDEGQHKQNICSTRSRLIDQVRIEFQTDIDLMKRWTEERRQRSVITKTDRLSYLRFWIGLNPPVSSGRSRVSVWRHWWWWGWWWRWRRRRRRWCSSARAARAAHAAHADAPAVVVAPALVVAPAIVVAPAVVVAPVVVAFEWSVTQATVKRQNVRVV